MLQYIPLAPTDRNILKPIVCFSTGTPSIALHDGRANYRVLDRYTHVTLGDGCGTLGLLHTS